MSDGRLSLGPVDFYYSCSGTLLKAGVMSLALLHEGLPSSQWLVHFLRLQPWHQESPVLLGEGYTKSKCRIPGCSITSLIPAFALSITQSFRCPTHSTHRKWSPL